MFSKDSQNNVIPKRQLQLPKIDNDRCFSFEPPSTKAYKLNTIFFPTKNIIKIKGFNHLEKTKETKNDDKLFKLDPHTLIVGKRNKEYIEKLSVLLHSRNDPDYTMKRFNLNEAMYQLDQNNNVCLTLRTNHDYQGNDHNNNDDDKKQNNNDSKSTSQDKDLIENRAKNHVIKKRYHSPRDNYYTHDSSIENKTYLLIKDYNNRFKRNNSQKNQLLQSQSQSDISNKSSSFKETSEIPIINVFNSYYRESNKIRRKLKGVLNRDQFNSQRMFSQRDLLQYNKSRSKDKESHSIEKKIPNIEFTRKNKFTQDTLDKMKNDVNKLDEINLSIRAWQIMSERYPKVKARLQSFNNLKNLK